MKVLLLLLILNLSSCNIMQAISDNNDPSGDFFEGQCRACNQIYNDLYFFHRFDNYNGTTYFDITSSVDLYETGSIGGDPTVNGIRGGATDCNQMTTADYILNGDIGTSVIGSNTDVSFSFWVKRGAQTANDAKIFEIATAGGNIYARQNTSTDDLYFNIGASGVTVNNFFNDTGWNHFVVRVDRNTGISYCVNGSCSGFDAQNTDGDNFSSTYVLHMCTYAGESLMDAQIDSFGMWTKILSNDEVYDLYTLSSPVE